jgi:hypothetical protein
VKKNQLLFGNSTLENIEPDDDEGGGDGVDPEKTRELYATLNSSRGGGGLSSNMNPKQIESMQVGRARKKSSQRHSKGGANSSKATSMQ